MRVRVWVRDRDRVMCREKVRVRGTVRVWILTFRGRTWTLLVRRKRLVTLH